MAERKIKESGIWIRGADGALYFISDETMASCQIPNKLAAKTLKELDEMKDVEGHGRPRGIKAERLPAIRGPLAIRDLVAAPAIIPPPPELRGLRRPG
jgi:hypothetical protein